MAKKLLAAVLFFTGLSPLQAQDGALDNTFGTSGISLLTISEMMTQNVNIPITSALLPDGKILVAGTTTNGGISNIILLRINSNGSADNTFGTNGKIIVNTAAEHEYGYRMKLQPDGKFVVAGTFKTGSASDIAVLRFNADGTLDNSFDGDGIVTTSVSTGEDWGYGLCIQTDGKIVVGGYSDNGSKRDPVWIRYNIDGTLDNSFDGDGIQTYTGFTNTAYIQDMALQPDGKIVSTGIHWYALSPSILVQVALFRLNTNGSIDNSFGTNGAAIFFPAGMRHTFGLSVRVVPGGKIVSGGYLITTAGGVFGMMARFTSAGTLDNTFGGGNGFFTDPGGGIDVISELVTQPDGKLIGIGYRGFLSSINMVIIKLTVNGDLDVSFDEDGKKDIDVNAVRNEGAFGLLQPDGKIVAGGLNGNGSLVDQIYFARLHNTVGGPLPVSWLDFTVSKQNNQSLLQWSTASEQNNKGFEVQRSTDGISFTKIGWVDGAGNSASVQHYSFTDASPAKGKNFYRLNQVDIDGKDKLSATRKIDFSSLFDITIYPNPATDVLNVLVSKNTAGIKIFDAQGKLVWRQENKAGLLSIPVPVQKLTAGLYILEVSDATGNKQLQKFIKE